MSRVYHVSLVDLDRRLSVIEERLAELTVHFPSLMGNEVWVGRHEEEEKSYEIPMEVNGELIWQENMVTDFPEQLFVEGDVAEMMNDLEKAQRMQNLCKKKLSSPPFFLKNIFDNFSIFCFLCIKCQRKRKEIAVSCPTMVTFLF